MISASAPPSYKVALMLLFKFFLPFGCAVQFGCPAAIVSAHLFIAEQQFEEDAVRSAADCPAPLRVQFA